MGDYADDAIEQGLQEEVDSTFGDTNEFDEK
jgi:hypothetical protein